MFKKKIILVALSFFGIATIFCIFASQQKFSVDNRFIILNGKKISIEIADTYEKRRLGLGGRDGMCQDCGMLFEFPNEGNYNFWMKDMRFPLDMVWISEGRVVHLEKNIASDFGGILKSENQADMVLEVNAGTSEKIGLKVGDKIDFQK